MKKKIISSVLAITLVLSAFGVVNASQVSDDSLPTDNQEVLLDQLETEDVGLAESIEMDKNDDYYDFTQNTDNQEVLLDQLETEDVGLAESIEMDKNDDYYDFTQNTEDQEVLLDQPKNEDIELVGVERNINSHGMAFTETKTNDIWTLKFDDSEFIWDIIKISDANNIYPESLRDSIVYSYGADRFSPFQNVIEKNPPVASIEIGRTRAGSTSVNNQNATAYLWTGNKTASGVWPDVGMCAMKSKVANNSATSSTNLKFGTSIYFGTPSSPTSINFNGYSKSSLQVTDTGPGTNRTDYWIDIYFGDNNDANYKAAIDYGVKTGAYFYWNY